MSMATDLRMEKRFCAVAYTLPSLSPSEIVESRNKYLKSSTNKKYSRMQSETKKLKGIYYLGLGRGRERMSNVSP